MCDQAGDGGAAGMVRTQDLTQKDPQRNQRRKNPIQPILAKLGHRLVNNLFRQNVSEGQISLLKELTPQKLNLVPIPSLVKMAHPWASLPVMAVVRNTI
jgi:hypothetical protein